MAKDEKAVAEILLKAEQPTATLKDLKNASRELNAQLQRLPIGTEEFVKKSEQLTKITERLQAVRNAGKNVNEVFDNTKKNLVGIVDAAKKPTASIEQLSSAIDILEANLRQLPAGSKSFTKTTEDINRLKLRLNEVVQSTKAVENAFDKAAVEIISKGQKSTATFKQMKDAAAALEKQLHELEVGSQKWVDATKDYKQVNARIQAANTDLKQQGSIFQRLGVDIKSFGGVMMGVFTGNLITTAFSKVAGFFSDLISNNAKLSDSLADIRKTTGMTNAEVEKFNRTLSQMDTRTSAADLREIAIAGGQLGVAKNDLLGFTGAVDKLNVALSDEFKGGAEEVTKTVGGLRNVFTDIKSEKIDDDILKIGNAINVLGQEGLATGPVVADFAGRIGGAGIAMGLTSGQVLGLSATLQELNISTERGGTAVTRIIQKMTTHVAEFARVADMDVKKFNHLVNTDLFGAFMKVVEGAKKGGASATALGKILDDLGVDGAGATEVINKLGGATGMLKQKVELASGALKDTNSIMNEFSIKNNTLGADIEKIGKNMAGWFTNSAILNGLKSMVGWIADVTDNTKKASIATEEERRELLMTEAEILQYNAGNANRTKLIKELQDKYPAYLSNLNAETVSNEELSAAINKVNNSLLNKIVIQQQDEKIAEQMKETAKATTDAAEAMINMRKQLSYVYEYNEKQLRRGAKINLKKDLAGLPMEVQVEEILKYENYTGAGISQFNEDLLDLRESFGKWKEAQLDANKAKMISNELDAKKQEILKTLGIGTDELIDKNKKIDKSSPKYVNPDAAKKAKKDLDDLNKKHEDFLKTLDKLKNENSFAGLDEWQTRYKKANDDYQAELNKLSDGVKLSEEELGVARKIIRDKRDAEYLKIEKEMNEKLLKEQEQFQREYEELTDSAAVRELKKIDEKYAKQLELHKNNAEETKKLLQKKQEDIAKLQAEADKMNNPEHKGDSAKQNKTKADTTEFKGKVDQGVNYFNKLGNIAENWRKSQLAAEEYQFNREQKIYDDRLKREQRLLDQKLISQSTYDDRVNAITDERQQKERIFKQKQFVANQTAAERKAIMDVASAGVKTLAEFGFTPAAGIAIALGAIEAGALIAQIKQQEVPQFAAGGPVNQATLLNSSSGMPFIAGEAGAEYVIPNWMMRQPVIANQVAMLEAIRTNRTFASGGLTAVKATEKIDSGKTVAKSNTVLPMAELIHTLNRLSDNIEGGIGVSYDLLVKTQKSIENAKKSSRVG